MLLARPPGLDARLPRDFAGMDIRDLIKQESSIMTRTQEFADVSGEHLTSGSGQRGLSSSQGTMSRHPNAMSAPHTRAPSIASSSTILFSKPTDQALHLDGSHVHNVHTLKSNPALLAPSSQAEECPEWPRYVNPNKRSSPPDDGEDGPPTKKSSTKWNSEENRQIIKLRGQGMKWSDISRHIPGRTGLACRLHYQNYLEKRGEWDEEKKNKLARVYER